jgi:hypothetical protein
MFTLLAWGAFVCLWPATIAVVFKVHYEELALRNEELARLSGLVATLQVDAAVVERALSVSCVEVRDSLSTLHPHLHPSSQGRVQDLEAGPSAAAFRSGAARSSAATAQVGPGSTAMSSTSRQAHPTLLRAVATQDGPSATMQPTQDSVSGVVVATQPPPVAGDVGVSGHAPLADPHVISTGTPATFDTTQATNHVGDERSKRAKSTSSSTATHADAAAHASSDMAMPISRASPSQGRPTEEPEFAALDESDLI